MSGLIVEYRNIREQIKALESRLREIETSPAFAREAEFEEALRKLMKTFGKSLRDIIQILDSNAGRLNRSFSAVDNDGSSVRLRKVLTYENPHTKEIVKSAGGNHKVLKEWRKRYPAEDIKNWVVKDA
ncbi:H-NS histone [Pseudomonas corrugata]|uniref:histone-like nucleoid-structuring protein, MvaT/MvaU family n=1 Tax=Pseudomonas corrugata TaxID=47879 RepID=UPI0018E61547|nr:histone-like nucleoid-structuring protein, MvaT/MvaU family [Pseudomonas corrugata]MBI6621529.1 H-NS histone [Pseudomonas corrugata]MBI6694236.1 H-NS histone [Pseudomonas corrugata]